MDVPAPGRKKRGLLKGLAILLGLVALFVAVAVFFPLMGDGDDGGLAIGKEKIAVVELFGPITESSEIIRQIRKFARDSSIKGILVHIDSPGGAVAPSQEIYNALLQAKKKKKVVASMGTLAASGGCYVAIGADKIVANPGTITGSIGVIMGFVEMRELLSKLGLNAVTIKSGKFKDIGSPARPFTEEDRKVLQSVIDDVYMQFVEAVAKERAMDIGEVKKLADGRIYSGRQGKEIGLVDELGGFRDAVRILGELAGITGEPYIVREKKEYSFIRELLDSRLGWLWQKTAPGSGGLYYLWSVN